MNGSSIGESSISIGSSVRKASISVGTGISSISVDTSISIGSNFRGMDGATSSGMGNLGSMYFGGVNRDDSSVGMSDQTSKVSIAGITIGSSIAIRMDETSSSSMSQLSSGNIRSVNRYHSTVRVGHKLGRGNGHKGRENQELHVGTSVLR